jgi:hypothetical protein
MLIASRITLRCIQATFDLKVAWMEAIAAIQEAMSIANSLIRATCQNQIQEVSGSTSLTLVMLNVHFLD